MTELTDLKYEELLLLRRLLPELLISWSSHRSDRAVDIISYIDETIDVVDYTICLIEDGKKHEND